MSNKLIVIVNEELVCVECLIQVGKQKKPIRIQTETRSNRERERKKKI
jgi:hypothetical protein